MSQSTIDKVAALKFLVLIPFRDAWPDTKACLESLQRQTVDGVDLRVVLIDNGSVKADTRAGINATLGRAAGRLGEVQHLRLDEPFNFSRLNNKAVAANSSFAADWLLFLNNDVELKTERDFATLVAFARLCPRPGAIGCTLEYPDQAVQHLFLAPGVKVVGAHPFKGFKLDGKAEWFQLPRPVAAVTGAMLLVRADSFAAAGRFDESLPTVGQDLDLCLKLQKLGLVNWALPQVRMIHKEGRSRGKAIVKAEVRRIYGKWGEYLIKNPYYSWRLSRFSETPAYRLLEPSYPWQKVLP